MTTLAANYLTETWNLLNEAAPWVLFGFLVAGLIKALAPDDFIAKHLGKPGAASVLKASALGAPIPLCSCGVAPAATGLRSQGASKGATAAFMISTPETGADSIAVTWALLDPVMTVLRPLAALVTATLAGLAVDALPDDPAPSERPAPTQTPTTLTARELPMKFAARGAAPEADGGAQCGPGCSCRGGHDPENAVQETPSLARRLRAGLGFAFGEMLGDIGGWLVLGILLAGLIAAFVPDDFFRSFLGGEWTSMLAMLAAGIPLYICATSSTPIAASMALKGLSPGAALVFLLAGPATNAATIAVAARVLGRRAALVYVACIALCALGLGWLTNRVYFALGLDTASWVRGGGDGDPTWFTALCSVALLALVARSRLARGRGHGHDCGCESGHGPHTNARLDGNDFIVK